MSSSPGSQTPGSAGAVDPFAAWRSMFQSGEEAWSQMLDQMMGTQAFAQSMGQFLETYLKAQEVTRTGVESNLSAMNFPTKSDLTRIAGQIVALDAKLDDVSFAMDELHDRVKSLAENGPEGIRTSMTTLTATVEALSMKIDALSTSGLEAVEAAASLAAGGTRTGAVTGSRSRVKQDATGAGSGTE